jgi:hypothetical protein
MTKALRRVTHELMSSAAREHHGIVLPRAFLDHVASRAKRPARHLKIPAALNTIGVNLFDCDRWLTSGSSRCRRDARGACRQGDGGSGKNTSVIVAEYVRGSPTPL